MARTRKRDPHPQHDPHPDRPPRIARTPSQNGKLPHHQAPQPGPLVAPDRTPLMDAVLEWIPCDCTYDVSFMNWAARLVSEHRPRTALQILTVARIIESAWRLRAHMKAPCHGGDDAKHARERAHIEQSLARAGLDWSRQVRMGMLLAREKRREAAADKPPASSIRRRANAPAAAPTPLRTGREPVPKPGYQPPPDVPPTQPINWRDYIAIDPEQSLEWPVLKGTTLEAESLASLLLDYTPEEMLSALPFINKTQIRAVQACDAEGMCGPWERAAPS